MQPDDQICYCFHIKKRKILAYLRIHRPRRASQLSECGGAGTGCGWCVPYLRKYFEAYQANGDASDADLTPDEYAAARQVHIEEGKGTPPGQR